MSVEQDNFLENKADVLYVIMGTNPFPNIISAVTRLKNDGRIICICTDETAEYPYERFRKLIVTKNITNKVEKIVIRDKSYMGSIKDALVKKLDETLKEGNNINLLELNYNGGTKVMSSAAYDVVKNYDYKKRDTDVNLTYIDPEREFIYCEYKRKNKQDFNHFSKKLSELNGCCDLSVMDIVCTYLDADMIRFDKIKYKSKMNELSNKLGDLVANMKNDDEYNKVIIFIKSLYCLSKKYNKASEEFKNELNGLFRNCSEMKDYIDINSLGFDSSKDMFNYFKKTEWLEEYILNILVELKGEAIIDDALSNITKKYDDSNKDEFEVDLVAYRKYKIFAISVTSESDTEVAKKKLYEIKQRAKYLAGDESGICFINLCWNVKQIEDEYKNIWDDFTTKNTLILGAQDFHNLKAKLKEWIMGGVRSGMQC
ncbi:hypothetical protein [Thermoanaerobacterium sp. RBIITD]|uniref:hypothetical protein n=1 Tax=Thermoanaerobacterium sp. RBIITD TaxID=1550240 RepID=UPI000BB97ECD|nr:hypothetical protein [Thermoanaerobacterium sp. RBIITD]SNX52849.1 hypothetical protein SAMN05660242_0301 [Thermoanaerobacterium sp. RBIITD]